MTKKALLVLADGKAFEGFGFAALRDTDNPAVGEVVFNTSMYGYQEILTDPSYAGQIMSFCYPHIGNVGCNSDDNESERVHVAGVICRNRPTSPSNFRADSSFEQFLHQSGVMGLYGIDTRELVLHLRDHGSQMGAFAIASLRDKERLQEKALAMGSMAGKEYVSAVTTEVTYDWNELPWDSETNKMSQLSQEQMENSPRVVVIDCGVKRNILRLLLGYGFQVKVVPASLSADQIMELQPHGVFLSNGPGDPATLQHLVGTVRELLGRVPLFGICLGHQVLAQALGGKTFKLKFGHRGCNHPIKDLSTGKVEIASHNHGFAVSQNGLPEHVQVTHLNLNDNTIAGIESAHHGAFSVQYHPEASSGPHDSHYLFQRFFDLVQAKGLSKVLRDKCVGEEYAKAQ